MNCPLPDPRPYFADKARLVLAQQAATEAMGCQKAMAQRIAAAGADYVLAL